MKTERYVEFFYPGAFFSESNSQRCEERNPNAIMYGKAFSFQFYDLETQVATLEDQTTFEKSIRKNLSPMYYPNAQTFTAEEVEQLSGDYNILLSNMRGNGYEKVIRTCRGNFQPYEEGKTVVL